MSQHLPPSVEPNGLPPLSERFAEAFQYAWRLHRFQRRKMGGTPFLAHLMSVAGLVLDYGGDEEEAMAALLHDAVEDQGGRETLEEIRRRFGDRVAEIVEGCSDSFQQPKPPWRQRKEEFLKRLGGASDSVRLVCAADKIHNLRCLLQAYQQEGERVWGFFRGGREGTLWYFRSVLEVLQSGKPLLIVQELAEVLDEMIRLVEANPLSQP